jgi:hypothetical protein
MTATVAEAVIARKSEKRIEPRVAHLLYDGAGNAAELKLGDRAAAALMGKSPNRCCGR